MKVLFKTMLIVLLTGMLVAFVPTQAVAQASAVTLSFITLTAPHAALGAPMQWEMSLKNTGSVTTQVGCTVYLVAPDSTKYLLFTLMPSLTAGQIKTKNGVFVTSASTNQLGTFTLQGYTTDPSTGYIIHEIDLPLTVTPVPSNGVYASVGGRGPSSAFIGYTSDYQTVIANLRVSPVTVVTTSTLVKPDATSVRLGSTPQTVINPGAYLITPAMVNSTQYSTATGTYSVRLDVSGSGKVLATDTFTFARNPLAAGMSAPVFEDMAMMAGMTYERMGMMNMPGCGPYRDQMMGGSGGAIADYDGDGLDDVFLTDMDMGMQQLYHNNGNGTFTDMAMAAGIPMDEMGMMSSAGAFADVDNDGRPDLLILYNEMENMLLHNNGDGTFTDITATSGLNTNPVPQNITGATFGDYDGDGFLDVYIYAHADCNQTNQNDHLFHNNGNNTFTDVTGLLGGSSAPEVNGRALAAAFVDYNNDNRPDLYVGNDAGAMDFSHPNVLWRNDGPDGNGGWIFTDVSSDTRTGLRIADMGLAFSDYDRTGVLNIFASNQANNVLLKQQSNHTFLEVGGDTPGGAHVARPTIPNSGTGPTTLPAVTWGSGFYDFNNDGWEDLFVAGGNGNGLETMYPSAMFVNNQDGTFLDLSSLSGTEWMMAMSMPTAMFTDFNNDGQMDILCDGMMGMPSLFMNMGGNSNHWLQVKLVGTTSNRDAVGARLVANVGGAHMLRQVINGGGYQGNSTLVQHFGLGSATQVDSLNIRWPSGMLQTMTNITADQKITVTEP